VSVCSFVACEGLIDRIAYDRMHEPQRLIIVDELKTGKHRRGGGQAARIDAGKLSDVRDVGTVAQNCNRARNRTRLVGQT
jgi:hypothetical protein